MRTTLNKYQTGFTTAVTGIVLFVLYRLTMSESVGFIDSGELASVAHTLGIAHPTGYPLFTLLGRLAVLIPAGGEPIVQLNTFSALCTAGAALVFFRFLSEFLSAGGEKNSGVLPAALAATAALATSVTFWSQAVSVEVYSLHLLFLSTILFLFQRGVHTEQARWWWLFSFVVGLSFTNHLTTVLLAPGLLWWFIAHFGWNKETFRRIGILSAPFAAGFSVNLFLLVRAAQQPLLNWGNPDTFDRWWWHFTGKQFRVWMFASTEAAGRQWNYFWGNLSTEYFFPFLIVAVIGALSLLFTDRKKFFIVVILFFTCVGYSINYDIHDIDSYFLLAMMMIALCIATGLETMLRHWGSGISRWIIIAAAGVLIVLQVMKHWSQVDQSDNFLTEDYTTSILTHLPPNAVVLSYQWDYFVAPSYYYQHVRKVRPDITVLDKELFRRSWYFPQLWKMYPEVMEHSRPEIDRFLPELEKFEHGRPYDYATIEGRFTDLLRSFMDRSDSRPVFVTSEIEPQYTAGFFRIPEGFLHRLTGDTTYVPAPVPEVNFRPFSGDNKYSRQIIQLQLQALQRRAAYERHYGRDSLASIYLQLSAKIRSHLPTTVSNF